MLTNWEDSPYIFKLRFTGEVVSYLAEQVGGKRHAVKNLWIPCLGTWTFHWSGKAVKRPSLPSGKRGKWMERKMGLELGEPEERIECSKQDTTKAWASVVVIEIREW